MQKFGVHWRLFYQSSCNDIEQLFKIMFPNSKIAESFFVHVILYDKSFNGVLHFGQIDFLIRFWHE